MSPSLTLPLIVLGLGLAGCASAPAPSKPKSEPAFYQSLANADAQLDAEAMRDMISLYRANKGLGPLALDPALQRVAQTQADAMARAGSASLSRKPLNKRLRESGATAARGVENVSAGYYTLAEAFSGWRDSRPHNAVMLHANAKRMGVATAYAPGAKYKVFWAMVLTE